MKTLKVLTFGTQDYLDSFSEPLRKDCDRYGYEFQSVTINDQEDISVINHRILEQMIKHITKQEFDRICFMDPECRIIKPIPQQWIDSDVPVVFFKIRKKNGSLDPKFIYHNIEGNGERLPCRIIGQPMFISMSDIKWLTMTLDLAKAASDKFNNVYTRNEMFIETALEYHGIQYRRENIMYKRGCDLKNTAVKGLWTTKDTVIQHPDIYGLFHNKVLAGNPMYDKSPILKPELLERHVHELNVLSELNDAMFKEKSNEWVTFEQWKVQPSTGKMMFGDLIGEKYHHSIQIKIQDKIITPAVKNFRKIFPDIDLV